ncbi:MAG: class I SAM-dependent methyltransferase, partial [Desulfosalsimonadaceae bacterium]|nr:class I SAM-dependent methyltransferase [Desulfosalsimonadaceae bacterium]
MTDAESRYRNARIAHWDRTAARKNDPGRAGAFYQRLLEHYYRMMVQPGLRILELGCGGGDLLACLKPSVGVGVDFSSEMINVARSKHPECRFIQADLHDSALGSREMEGAPIDGKIDGLFDVIILSDLINDLWDVQTVFENIRRFCHPRTRIIINFYSNLWKVPLGVVKRMGKGADLLPQNWLAQNDVINLLRLAGFDAVNDRSKILLPLPWAVLAVFFNRFLANIVPFRWFCLTNFIVARPAPETAAAKAPPSVS